MRVTTRDIALRAGVSQSTVSVVLSNNRKISISEQTRAHVIRIAEEMGYRGRSRHTEDAKQIVIGVMVPTLSNLYYPALIQKIQIHARQLGVTVVLQNTLRSLDGEMESFRYLQSIGAKGVLCLLTPKTPVPSDLPAVVIGEEFLDMTLDTVSLNSFAAGQLAGEHLLSLGHRKIAYISTPFSVTTDARRKRMEGLLDAMSKEGVADDLVVYADDHENERIDSTYEFDCGCRLTQKLLDEHADVTAIVAVNDMTAMGCISVLNQNNIPVPEKMAVCGFDKLWFSGLSQPQLTSVDQMAFHGCQVGLSMLLDKINHNENGELPVVMEYKPRLYVRKSTQR